MYLFSVWCVCVFKIWVRRSVSVPRAKCVQLSKSQIINEGEGDEG